VAPLITDENGDQRSGIEIGIEDSPDAYGAIAIAQGKIQYHAASGSYGLTKPKALYWPCILSKPRSRSFLSGFKSRGFLDSDSR
jgi:hypothetical protein